MWRGERWRSDGRRRQYRRRLEGIWAPDSVCLPEDAYRQVKARLDLAVSWLPQALDRSADVRKRLPGTLNGREAALTRSPSPYRSAPRLVLRSRRLLARFRRGGRSQGR